MLPTGKLYVPGAEEAAPAMGRLVDAVSQNTHPPHCLRGTRGAQKIPETEQANPFPFSLVPYPPGLVPGLVLEHREILLLKKNFNVFTNPNTEALLTALDPVEIV